MRRLVIDVENKTEQFIELSQEELDLIAQEQDELEAQSRLDALVPNEEELLDAKIELKVITTLLDLEVI